MTMRDASLRRSVPLVLLASAGLVVVWSVERGSVERANRLHRARDLPVAAGIYTERLRGGASDPRLRYNLGTTLLQAGVSGAAAELAAASQAPEPDVRTRSQYNLGLWNLQRATETPSTDSVRLYASASIAASKEALRLGPGNADARWNLAIANRLLDSVGISEPRAGAESVDGSADADQLAALDDASSSQDETSPGDAPQEGQDEAPASPDEVEPLTTLEADDVLGQGHLDASSMIRKLLAYEGREQRLARIGRTPPRW